MSIHERLFSFCSQLYLLTDRDSFSMNGAEIGILKERNEISLTGYTRESTTKKTMINFVGEYSARFLQGLRLCLDFLVPSWSARIAVDWNRRSFLKSCAISRTNRWNGSLRMRSSVDFWNLRISRNAHVPGLNLLAVFTPPVPGELIRFAFVMKTALVASCFLGIFPPVDFRAVCFERAIGWICMCEQFKEWIATKRKTVKDDKRLKILCFMFYVLIFAIV